MNNYCRNCGIKLESNTKECPKCKAKVFEERIDPVKKSKDIKDYKNKENIVLLVFLLTSLLFFATFYLKIFKDSKIIIYLTPIILVSPIITLIYGCITLKQSKVLKSILIVIGIVALIIFVVSGIVIYVLFDTLLSGCY